MSARYQKRTRNEIGRYTPWADVDREDVPPPVQELLDPTTTSAVVIEERPSNATKYRRKQGHQ